MRLRASGATVPEIAHWFGISRNTVKAHIAAAYDSEQVDNLQAYCVNVGWLRVPLSVEDEGYPGLKG